VSRPSRGDARVAVRIISEAWHAEVERYDVRSPARRAAERERRRLEEDGVSVAQLQPCAEDGPDHTRLAGLLKVYVPISEAPPSRRPFGFVFSAGRDQRGTYLALVAFGERHPPRGTRSVYERAHKRLHGRYPDQ
jgi:hypothetical protein